MSSRAVYLPYIYTSKPWYLHYIYNRISLYSIYYIYKDNLRYRVDLNTINFRLQRFQIHFQSPTLPCCSAFICLFITSETYATGHIISSC